MLRLPQTPLFRKSGGAKAAAAAAAAAADVSRQAPTAAFFDEGGNGGGYYGASSRGERDPRRQGLLAVADDGGVGQDGAGAFGHSQGGAPLDPQGAPLEQGPGYPNSDRLDRTIGKDGFLWSQEGVDSDGKQGAGEQRLEQRLEPGASGGDSHGRGVGDGGHGGNVGSLEHERGNPVNGSTGNLARDGSGRRGTEWSTGTATVSSVAIPRRNSTASNSAAAAEQFSPGEGRGMPNAGYAASSGGYRGGSSGGGGESGAVGPDGRVGPAARPNLWVNPASSSSSRHGPPSGAFGATSSAPAAFVANGAMSSPRKSALRDRSDGTPIKPTAPETPASPNRITGRGGWRAAAPQWQVPPVVSREGGSKAGDSKRWGAVSKSKGSGSPRGSGGGANSGGSGATANGSGGNGSKGVVVPTGPTIKVPRAELLGAVVARLIVRRGLVDEDAGGSEESSSSAGEGSGSGGGSSDDEDESDSESEEEEEEEEAEEEGEGGEEGEKEKEKEEKLKEKKRRRRRRRRRRRKGEAATVVREAVVSTWDEIGGRYVLVNAHGDEERMTLEELEVALQQSQVRSRDGRGIFLVGVLIFLVASRTAYQVPGTF